MSNAAKLIQDQKNILPENSPVPNRKILIVEDEISIAEGMREILCPTSGTKIASSRSNRNLKVVDAKAPGGEFDVVVVHSPTDALKVIESSLKEQRPFAMGFFDVMLGADIDGIELVKRVLAMDSDLIAVFVTAYHDRNVDSIGTVLGDTNRERWDYINKPFTDGEILQKARNSTSLWDLHRLKEWQATRLSEAHQLLLQTERLNSAAAVGRSVAHEFGNLMTHILGHAEIALQNKSPAAMQNSLEIILKASDTAVEVLKRFRRLNDNSEIHSRIRSHNLARIVEEALELMEFRFRKHSVKVDKSKLKPLIVDFNRNALIQVIVNILINGLHAMPNGGTFEISLSEKDGSSLLQIKDTGGGIPEDILPRIMEPLFTTKGSEGSGLGLAICKEIIEIEHGGEFKIENHPSGGVIVTIQIPLVQQEESNGPQNKNG